MRSLLKHRRPAPLSHERATAALSRGNNDAIAGYRRRARFRVDTGVSAVVGIRPALNTDQQCARCCVLRSANTKEHLNGEA